MYTNLYITYIYLFVYFKSDYFSVIFTSVSFCMDKSVHTYYLLLLKISIKQY